MSWTHKWHKPKTVLLILHLLIFLVCTNALLLIFCAIAFVLDDSFPFTTHIFHKFLAFFFFGVWHTKLPERLTINLPYFYIFFFFFVISTLTSFHKFSIEFESGLWAGQSKTAIYSEQNQFFTRFDECSCMNFHLIDIERMNFYLIVIESKANDSIWFFRISKY